MSILLPECKLFFSVCPKIMVTGAPGARIMQLAGIWFSTFCSHLHLSKAQEQSPLEDCPIQNIPLFLVAPQRNIFWLDFHQGRLSSFFSVYHNFSANFLNMSRNSKKNGKCYKQEIGGYLLLDRCTIWVGLSDNSAGPGSDLPGDIPGHCREAGLDSF